MYFISCSYNLPSETRKEKQSPRAKVSQGRTREIMPAKGSLQMFQLSYKNKNNNNNKPIKSFINLLHWGTKHVLSKFQNQRDKKGSPPPTVKFCRTGGENIIKSRGKQKLSEGTAANRTRDIDPGSEELVTVRKSSKTKQMKQTENPFLELPLTSRKPATKKKLLYLAVFQETKVSGNLFLFGMRRFLLDSPKCLVRGFVTQTVG